MKNYWIRNLNFLENMEDAILIVDAKGKVLDSNHSAQNMGLLPEKNNVKERFWYSKLVDQDPKEHSYLTIPLPSGKKRFVCRTISILVDEKEPAKAFYFRDLTDQILYQAKAKRFESLFRRRELKIRELEIRDKLTGLFNRMYTIEAFQAEVHRAERSESKIGVVYFDVDRLKAINEIYGTSKGDEFLKAFGKILLDNSRRSDISSRVAGEEFLLLLPGASRNIVLERAEKIRRLFSEFSITEKSKAIQASVSVGVAMFPEDGSTQDILLKEAQAALSVAKKSGRNRVVSTSRGDFEI
ncbi:sensor domain-containing diguanylate cyclase [Leptospira langatensis]|uniref:sensor domain-containing diguanylate cyclase n=1 Tax=Leptospira langatensis TaxID=2484983 RepID=UPI001FE580B2|nr:diguanylate cyclase [Leptospira langatensis]